MLMKHLFQNVKSSTPTFYRSMGKTFAAAAAKPEGSSISLRFHELYVKELDRIQQTSSELIAAKYKVDNTKTPTEAYVHPYHSTKFPVYWSTQNLMNFMHEAIGNEPVSPHYESYVRSRRFLFLTGGMLYVINLLDTLNLNSFYGQHAIYELYTLLLFSIGLFEMRFLMQKMPAPRLTWFYAAYTDHEMDQFWLNWQDRIEELSRPFLSISKEQIDYFLIHKEFIYIKKRSLSVFLESEKKNLDKHFYERTVDMLKSIEFMENSNVKHKIKETIEDAIKTVLQRVETAEGRKNLHTASFSSALQGLKSGKMTYEGDALLPLFVNEIRSRLEPIKNLTPEEERKMFALSAQQRSQITENDHRAKVEYLARPPDVTSASVKNTDSYKNIISRMKRRIESNFKI